MGRDKALLPIGDETMLQRIIRVISQCVDPKQIVVVASADQCLPALPCDVEICRDADAYQGPLVGLATGLSAVTNRADAVFVSACDTPLLRPEFIEQMFSFLGDAEIAVPAGSDRFYPLAAVYRVELLPRAQVLIDSGERRLNAFLEQSRVRKVSLDELVTADPELVSLRNINTEHDYSEVLSLAAES